MCCRRCRRAPHGVGERCTSTTHAPHESAQRGHAQQGHEQQVHATRAWEAQARITQACTASACTAGTRNTSMGDASATTQACTPAQSTGRCTPAMSTTLTSTIWENAAQVHHTPSTKARSTRMHSKGTHNSAGHEQQVHATRAWEAQARITQAYTASALSGQGAHQPAVSSGQRSAHLHLGSPMNSCCKATRSCQRPGVRDRLQHAASSAATRSRAAATFVSTRAHFPVSTCSCNGSLCGRMLAAAGRQRQVWRITVPGRLPRPPQALCEVMPTA